MGPETEIQEAEQEIKRYQKLKDIPLCPMNDFGACKGERCAWFVPEAQKCAVLFLAQATYGLDLFEE
jgi:hypothetical protein